MSEKLKIYDNDNIKISIPNKPEFVGVVRLTTSAISNRLGFNIEEIDDIKVAVAEACTIILESQLTNTNIDIEYILNDNEMTIFVRSEISEQDNEQLAEKGLGLFIIKSLMNEVEMKDDSGIKELKMIKRIEDVAQ
ncbi:ATP-binding protein [Sporosalibacterium faouarense]|uniref:ATP-binding protein n=1 Tax=Sporosalibacterium faouarense TaxID=516123 RepID=UPI00141C3B25|nr:ATP-binding protein [Sporosalibacterium faouarense]MTI49778.1 histidine kinase [Bacillota bacterium]